MNNYKKRIVDDLLDLKLESFGATLIVGPKGCERQPQQSKNLKVSSNFKMRIKEITI